MLTNKSVLILNTDSPYGLCFFRKHVKVKRGKLCWWKSFQFQIRPTFDELKQALKCVKC